jgi:nitrate/TMAO reductase-like tetraheme cytochrome c subunit
MNRFISSAAVLNAVAAMATLHPVTAAAEEVADQFACQACHVERLRELKRPRGPMLIEAASISAGEHGEQEPASTSRMCLSCHDGFVEDARYVWSEKHVTHPVGVTLPEGMTMKTIEDEPVFPLNEDDEVYCGTCHTGHLGDGAAAKAKPFLRVDAEKGEMCSNCHAEQTTVAGSPHAEVRRRQPPDFDARGVCGRCHAPHENFGPRLWAKETGTGKHVTETMCNSCHRGQPDPASHPTTVLAWSQDVRDNLGAKSDIAMPVFDADGRHADRGRIGCPTCHNPHEHAPEGWDEDVPARFLRAASPQGTLCADCHASQALFRYKFYHSRKRNGR